MVLACGLSGLYIKHVSFSKPRLFLKRFFFYVLAQIIHALSDEQRFATDGWFNLLNYL